MSGDHLERLDTFASHWQSAMDDDLVSDVIAVIDGRPLRKSDLGALLTEAEQLRSARTFLDGQVFVAGWYAHAEACVSLGWDVRESAWRKYREEMAEAEAKDAPQRPSTCPCGCPVVEGMCSCPQSCPCEGDCLFCDSPASENAP